jgi:hypothetical protein
MAWPLSDKELRMRIPMLAIIMMAAPLTGALGQEPSAPTPPAAAPAPAGMQPEVRPGAEVRDTSGARVGTVEAVENGVATVATGQMRVALPLSSFAQRDGVLTISMSAAELEAAARAAPPN